MFRRAAALTIVVGAAAFVFPAGAQSVSQRASLEQLRATLDQIPTIEAVRAQGQTSLASESPGMRLVRSGLVSLRLGEISGDRAHFDRAIIAFDQAAVRAPAWPYPWFGLARAKRALAERAVLVKASDNQLDGVSYYLGFTQAMVAAFKRDSLFQPALDLLRKELNRQGERRQPDVLLAPLQRAAASPGATPVEFLVLARALRDRELIDSALTMVDGFRGRGGDRGVAALEEAHTLALKAAFPAAASAYLYGLERPTSTTRAAYRLDLRWIAEKGELTEFDRTPDDSLADWVVDFWRWRDIREMRQPGERLVEHLRRWAVVERNYRVDHPERRTQFRRVWALDVGPCSVSDYYMTDDVLPDSELRSLDGRFAERLYDDRAYVYMRHGRPALTVSGLGPPREFEDKAPTAKAQVGDETGILIPREALGVLVDDERRDRARANQSWLYWIQGERRVFHFEGSNALGLAGPTALVVEPLPDYGWLQSRSLLDPKYEKLGHQLGERTMPPKCRALYQAFRTTARKDAGVGLTTDSYTLLFRHDLQPVVQVYALGRPDRGTGRILVVFALSGEHLRPDGSETDHPPGLVYPVETRVSATDSSRRAGFSVDTLRRFVTADTLRRGSHLTGYVELPVTPGLYRVGTALFQPGAEYGGAQQRDGVDLRVPASGLYLSDLVLGREGSGLTWKFAGEQILLNPLGAYTKEQTVEVYYQMSGLESGRSYQTSILLAPVTGADSKENIRLRFTEVAGGEELTVRRKLGLEKLKPGQYQLSVEVSEEGSSRVAHRQQYLTIREPGPNP